ncbi:MAG: lipid A biosynthesis acyltransferase [Gammaproteobacteria bacterium HGW-Gammaproteobacteria-14]|nr:MAG: lipid A biosynthesis acyltransferase [Gammaproteobacteria bacterium HGW-Gammaproteobacteria-14]
MKKKHVFEARVIKLFSIMPLSIVIGFAAALSWLFCHLPLSVAKPYRIAMLNIAVCFPQKSWHEARALARRAFIETAKTLAGYSHVWLRPVPETLARVDRVHGEEAWLAALNDDRPILYLSLHQSSWEVPVLTLGQKDRAIIMYQPGGDSALEDLVKEGRQGTGCTLVPTNGDGVRAALEAMGRGGSLGLLADHKPGGTANPYAPFFGHDVMVPVFVYKVIQRYRPHVFFVSAQRSPDYRFEVWFESAAEMLEMNEAETMKAMNAGFERIVLRNPEQYQWTYKRFTRGSQGQRDWYKQSKVLLERLRKGEPSENIFVK